MNEVSPTSNFFGVLSRADADTLGSLLRPEARRLIQRLDPKLYYPGALSALVMELRPPIEILADQSARDLVFDLLRPQEASALSGILGLGSTGDPYSAIRSVNYSKTSNRTTLWSFFQIVEESAPDVEIQPSTAMISPEYPLFAHQVDAISRAQDLLSVSPHRLLLHMPTGAGKTRTAMNLIADYLRRDPKNLAIWLAHSEELCSQAVDEFVAAWKHLGNLPVQLHRFWGTFDIDLGNTRSGMIVAGLPKLVAKLKADAMPLTQLSTLHPLVVLDEAHQAVAPTYRLILGILADHHQSSLLGLSATPGRTWNDISEDADLASVFARHKVGLRIPGYTNPVTYLVDEGYLAKATFRQLKSTSSVDLSAAEKEQLETLLDIPSSVLDTLALSEQRNLQIIAEVESLCKRHSRILLFAASVYQSEILATVLRARGIRAQSVTSKQSFIHRRSVIDDYKNSTDPIPYVLCNYGILTTGFDAPKTSAAIIARPTLSLVLYSQMVGRAIRGIRAGGNTEAEVVTVVDTDLPGFASVESAFTNWEDVWEDADEL